MRILFSITLSIFVYQFSYLQTTQTFITSGTFLVPSGVTSIMIEAWGAGGAGGSAAGTGPSTNYRAQAGGGGGGAYVVGAIFVSPGDMISYIVGPNTGANSSSSFLNGDASTFGSISAPGGQGGESLNAGTSGGHIGGLGGVGGIGTFNGGAGGSRVGYSGSTTAGTSAGGGGGAGNSANGSDANITTNAGGAGGFSDGGNGASGPSSGNAGAGGSVRGGGGGGAWAAASTVFRNGGAGARGEIRITYTVLPIKIESFDISNKNHKSVLKLTTASESNNDYFTIERSADGRSFDAIGEIKGAGNSNTTIYYEYTDEKPYAGINFYRIKQTDYDGKYSYSDIKSVRHNTVGNLNITPRTTEGRLQVTTDIEAYSLDVYNVAGQQVKSFKSLSKDQYISIDDLTTGLYFIKINHDGQVETTKIVKI